MLIKPLLTAVLRLFSLTLLLLAAPALAEGRKLALVVGNQDYQHVPGLQTPVEDAQAMSSALRDLGFEVTVLTDVGTEVFNAVLDTFAGQAADADTVLFYYSGHAFQMDGVNHLVPVSAKLADAASIAAETWTLNAIAAKLKSPKGQLLIFLDACRDNPLPDGAAGDNSKGLAQFDGGAGTFVSFATAPGQLAWDKEEGKENSPYTAAILSHIATPAQSLSDLMIAVRNDVEKATGGKQTPWELSSLRSQFFFIPATIVAAAAEETPTEETPALPEFDVVEADSQVLPDETQLAAADVEATRLEPLNSETRSLAVLNGVPVLDPAVVTGKPAEAVVVPPAAELPRAVQAELERINCYGMRVDGQWGNGSRNAMRTYYKAKNLPEGEVEPTEAVYRALKAEPEKTCAEPAAVAAKKAPAEKAAKKSGTTTKKQSTKKAAATKKKGDYGTKKKADPAPAQKGGVKCKFVVVAIICGP